MFPKNKFIDNVLKYFTHLENTNYSFSYLGKQENIVVAKIIGTNGPHVFFCAAKCAFIWDKNKTKTLCFSSDDDELCTKHKEIKLWVLHESAAMDLCSRLLPLMHYPMPLQCNLFLKDFYIIPTVYH